MDSSNDLFEGQANASLALLGLTWYVDRRRPNLVGMECVNLVGMERVNLVGVDGCVNLVGGIEGNGWWLNLVEGIED